MEQAKSKFIKIADVVAAAEARGFRAQRFLGGGYAELWAPNSDVGCVHHDGALYSTCDFVLSDSANRGYGYNGFFNGPFHPGLMRRDNIGYCALMSHPAMQDIAIEAA